MLLLLLPTGQVANETLPGLFALHIGLNRLPLSLQPQCKESLMKTLATALAVSTALVLSPPAQARHLHVHYHTVHASSFAQGLGYGLAQMLHFSIEHPIGARPRQWCGWWLRQQKGVADPSYNLARNWAHYGSPTSLHPGAVVVWNHHVGEAAAGECPAGRVMLHSGNDGHAVRTRCVSLRGVIAIRE